jgi:glycosyltransferase involved in cell wall biosynthesis
MSTTSQRRPSVLHVITRLDCGGAATNTIDSADLLRSYGFDTELAYGVTRDPDGKIGAKLESLRLPCHFLPDLVREIAPWRDVRTVLGLKHLIQRQRYDLVHTHTSKAGTLGRLAARWCGVPAVHTPHGHIFYGYFGRLTTRLFVGVERAMARGTARLVSLTDLETRDSLERNIGRPEQYSTIPSGVPLDTFRDTPCSAGRAFRRELDIPDNAVLFVSAGRLVRVKGFDVLLQGFAEASFGRPDILLAIVGDGEEHARLEALVMKLGIESRVRLAGHRHDIRPALRAADAFVLCSRNEGMGRALIEAMCAGLPVIGTDVGGVPVFLRHMENGWLVPRSDVSALARAMETLAASAELRQRLGQAAARSVYPEYDRATMIRRLADLYRPVIRGRTESAERPTRVP